MRGRAAMAKRILVKVHTDQSSAQESQPINGEMAALFADFAPSALAMLDLQMRYVMVNRRWRSDFALGGQDLIGRSHYEVFPDIPERWKAIHRRCLAGATEKCDEDPFVRADGTVTWLRWEVHPWHDAAGDIGGLLLHSADITVRKRAEMALAESEEHLREVGSHSRDCIWIVGLNPDRNLYFSAAIERIWGLTPEQLYQDNYAWQRSIHPDDQRRIAQAWEACCAGTLAAYDVEYRVIRPDGSICWVSDVGTPIRDAAGNLVRISGIARDITEQKLIAMALRDSEQKLRALFEASRMGIVLTDMHQRFVDFNESYCRITGYSAEELRALDYRQLTIEEDRAETEERLQLMQRTGHLDAYEKTYRRKDGSLVPVRLNGAQFSGSDGRKYQSTIVEDITDRRRLEHALVDSMSMEQQKLGRDLHDGLGQELAGIAMLASAAASSLKKAGRPEAAHLDDVAKFASQAVANCRALAHGLSPSIFSGGNLVGLLREMATLQRNSFGFDARCEVIEAAPLKLGEAALENFYRISQEAVANARRHGQAKSISITLNIQPTTVRLDVVDDGIGMSQAPEASTGMGLKIMAFRAELIGARLAIKSGEHGGTQVMVECPQPREALS